MSKNTHPKTKTNDIQTHPPATTLCLAKILEPLGRRWFKMMSNHIEKSVQPVSFQYILMVAHEKTQLQHTSTMFEWCWVSLGKIPLPEKNISWVWLSIPNLWYLQVKLHQNNQPKNTNRWHPNSTMLYFACIFEPLDKKMIQSDVKRCRTLSIWFKIFQCWLLNWYLQVKLHKNHNPKTKNK